MPGMIVHEWLEPFGGAENVVDRFAALYPDAPIQALWNDAPNRYADGRVAESWVARTPLRKHKALALPFLPQTWRSLPARDIDWIVCSSHLFAHHARFAGPAREAPKYVYVHTPARYLWNPEIDDRGRNLAVKLLSPALRHIDHKRAAEATSIVGNSKAVRDRIREHWDVDAGVLYPPVDVQDFRTDPELNDDDMRVLASLPSEYLLGASRFVPYKQLHTVVRAGAASGLPVVLAGDGPDRELLRALAEQLGVRVHFVIHPRRELLKELYRRAVAYVFPAVEDFGIMPVEAMASGAPVIGRRVGGVAETVADGVSGALIDNFEGSEFRSALEIATSLDREQVRARADLFDATVFDRKVRDWLPS